MNNLERLNELKTQQLQALKFGDFVALNEINKKMFAIREELRKERKKAREQAHENKTAEKIDAILTR